MKISPLRIWISLLGATLPFLLLSNGVYGSFLFTFSVPLFWQLGVRGDSLRSLGVKKEKTPASLIVGVCSGLLLGLCGGALLQSLGIADYSYTPSHQLTVPLGNGTVSFPLQGELGYKIVTMRHTVYSTPLFFFFSIAVIGLGEELFWRGFIQQKLSLRMSGHGAIWLTALVFGLIHFYLFAVLAAGQATVLVMLITLGGALWGYLFLWLGNIWAPALSHGVTAFIVWKYYFFTHLN